MTETERLALDIARRFLRSHVCDVCGKQWITAASTAVLMHKCRAPRRGISRFVGLEESNAVRDRAWAEKTLGLKPIAEAIEAAVGGPDAWYTDDEEE
ncbi:MAG: hypothetical protein ACRDZM_15070 [Acidimicrobiia bacterium]